LFGSECVWGRAGMGLIVGRIPRIQGAQECTLTAEADLAITTHRQAWSRPPIQLDFSGMSRFRNLYCCGGRLFVRMGDERGPSCYP
jgi:hypothetical protein